MELEIIKEKENLLFARKEIQASVETQVTPSRNEIQELIAQKFSTQRENVSINGIHGRFGSKTFMINANIYSSKEEKEKNEPKSKRSSSETPAEEPSQTPSPESPTQESPSPQSDSPAIESTTPESPSEVNTSEPKENA